MYRVLLFFFAAFAPAGCLYDKEAHFAAGVAVSGYVTERTGSPAYGCLAALPIGAAKEAFDRSQGSFADGDDILATTAGCSLTIRW